MKKSPFTKALIALAGFAVLFAAFWLFFHLGGGGFYWEINGQTFNASPAFQGALAAMLFPLFILAMAVFIVVIFSVTWLSIGFTFIATLAMVALAFLPVLAPLLLPVAFFFLLLALFSRADNRKTPE
jgi:hypothetical protein